MVENHILRGAFEMSETHDVVIVGSGPAGYTAALYAARANLEVLVFQGFEAGGQLMLTSDVDSFQEYRHGVIAQKMIDDLQDLAVRFGGKVHLEHVVTVVCPEGAGKLWADGVAERTVVRAVVIA